MIEKPSNAVVLFDGNDLNGWKGVDGEAPNWDIDGAEMTVKKGSIVSEETFIDAFIHLEFRTPYMPEAIGQKRGNSGVFLQNRYEIQVLDSYGIEIPGTGDCGAIYKQYAPLVNACKPPLEWQAYDIVFRAARFHENGEVSELPRITVIHNGLVIQNNVIIQSGTSKNKELVKGTGPLMLQDHRDPVSYRNIWLVHLPLEGSDIYEPR